jgi:hypothetical protein
MAPLVPSWKGEFPSVGVVGLVLAGSLMEVLTIGCKLMVLVPSLRSNRHAGFRWRCAAVNKEFAGTGTVANVAFLPQRRPHVAWVL